MTDNDKALAKKKYESPRVTVIGLRPEEAVLGNCKSAITSNSPNIGTGGTCASPGGCSVVGS